MQRHRTIPAVTRTSNDFPRRSLLAQACALLILPLAAQTALAQEAAPAEGDQAAQSWRHSARAAVRLALK